MHGHSFQWNKDKFVTWHPASLYPRMVEIVFVEGPRDATKYGG